MAPALWSAGCRTFFVATVEEALDLRGLLPAATVYTLGGAPGAAAPVLAAGRIRPVLNDLGDARRWASDGAGQPAALQIDSGLTRAGFDAGELAALVAEPAVLDRLNLCLLLTHYACADEPERPENERQRRAFEALAGRWPALPRSAANSAALGLGPGYGGDVVRPGIALYGVAPGAAFAVPLAPVARLEARVMQVRTLSADAGVGYGATVRVRAGARLALLGLGYADGYPRCLGGGVGVVLAGGRRVPVLGRVSMDLTTVDVSALGDDAPRVGDYLTLFGGGLPLADVAAAAGTLPYEILTGLGARVRRVYVGAAATG